MGRTPSPLRNRARSSAPGPARLGRVAGRLLRAFRAPVRQRAAASRPGDSPGRRWRSTARSSGYFRRRGRGVRGVGRSEPAPDRAITASWEAARPASRWGSTRRRWACAPRARCRPLRGVRRPRLGCWARRGRGSIALAARRRPHRDRLPGDGQSAPPWTQRPYARSEGLRKAIAAPAVAPHAGRHEDRARRRRPHGARPPSLKERAAPSPARPPWQLFASEAPSGGDGASRSTALRYTSSSRWSRYFRRRPVQTSTREEEIQRLVLARICSCRRRRPPVSSRSGAWSGAARWACGPLA